MDERERWSGIVIYLEGSGPFIAIRYFIDASSLSLLHLRSALQKTWGQPFFSLIISFQVLSDVCVWAFSLIVLIKPKTGLE